MTVATFLASANFVALFEILINKPEELAGKPLKPLPTICDAVRTPDLIPIKDLCSQLQPYFTGAGFLLIALAAGLFIVTVYLYDRLGMPSGFWLLKTPWWIDRNDANRTELLLLHGYPQAHMIRIWTRVFTPAVACSVGGVILLVLATGIPWLVLLFLAICGASYWIFLSCLPSGDVD
jgi:hypothetical protein